MILFEKASDKTTIQISNNISAMKNTYRIICQKWFWIIFHEVYKILELLFCRYQTYLDVASSRFYALNIINDRISIRDMQILLSICKYELKSIIDSIYVENKSRQTIYW